VDDMNISHRDRRAFELLFGRCLAPGEAFTIGEADYAYYRGLRAVRPGLWSMLRTWWGG